MVTLTVCDLCGVFLDTPLNKLPWLKHDGSASLDSWLRSVVRAQGIGAGWIFWGLAEQLHTHGSGNTFRRDIRDVIEYSCTSKRVLFRVLVQLSLEYDSKTRFSFKVIGKQIEVEIKNFRKKQEKNGSKKDSKHPENNPETAQIRVDKNITDKNRIDKSEKIKKFSEESQKISALLATLMRSNDSKAKVPEDFYKWNSDASNLLKKDGRDLGEVLRVLNWCQSDGFWRSNILSMAKFRKQYSQLKLKMEGGNAGESHKGSAGYIPGKYASG